MKPLNPQRRIALLLVAAVLFANPLFGQTVPAGQSQQKKAPPSPSNREDATLETLFAADSYKMYGEVRMVGQLVRSPGVVELLEPLLKGSNPPKEFKALIDFLNTNAEALAAAPMLFAVLPAKPGLPQTIVAIELPSVEEAQKFEPKVQKLLPLIFPTPTPTPTPTPSPTPDAAGGNKPSAPETPPVATGKINAPYPLSEERKEPAGPAFLIKRSGAVIVISDAPFTFKNLRPAGSKLLAEDANFRVARDRFSSEPLFIYYNVGLENRLRAEQMATLEAQASAGKMQMIRKEETIVVASSADPGPETPPADPDASPAPEPSIPEPSIEEMEMIEREEAQRQVLMAQARPTPKPDPTDPFLSSLFGAFGSGEPAWPEALGIALAFESDAHVIRVILIDPPTAKTTPIPFLPQLISGRAMPAGAPTVLPADTEFFASASLDLPQMYAALLQNLQKMNTVAASYAVSEPGELPAEPVDTSVTEAAFEKKYGFKIKEELLPALGNEIAIGGTLESFGLANEFGMRPARPAPTPSPSPSSQLGPGPASPPAQPEKKGPVFLISVSDRDAVKGLIPRLLDAMGMKALGLVAQTEKRDDTEMITFAGMFSYAFVDKFLVLSPDVASVRRVVDSYVNHETLSGNAAYRNFTRWQPREVQGQIYVSPAVMGSFSDAARNPGMDATMQEFMAKLNPAPEAITYALSNGGFGPLHELHLPKNVIMMMVFGVSAASNQSPLDLNESVARSALMTIVNAQERYKATEGNGNYATMSQLGKMGVVSPAMYEKYGYKIELTVSGSRFEATATPIEYGVTGRISLFVDETGVIKGGDHGGAPASAGDLPAP